MHILSTGFFGVRKEVAGGDISNFEGKNRKKNRGARNEIQISEGARKQKGLRTAAIDDEIRRL